VLTDPFSDFRSLRRWSAAVLCAALAPLSVAVAVGFGAGDSRPGLLLAAVAILIALAVVCAVVGDGMPPVAWEVVVVVLAAPFILITVASTRAGEALAPAIILTVGWSAMFLPRRALVVSLVAGLVAYAIGVSL